ncbi:SDR family NAD(P)-dependent oxidoreductase [Microbaculum marinum]|uniref:SDR family NAD(P)-dependent oxidoreductase n=1 Tax=Microbaculum marinum TaxID=1764581 RepID=A0AAW9RTN9_9HYPH
MTAFDVHGVALVTGAANGIGRASALALARAGADVALLDLEGAPLSTLAAEIRAMGRRAVDLAVDCTDAALVEEAVRTAEADLGPVDVLFNNVGQSARERASPFIESEEDTWRFVIEVSLLTTMRVSRLIAPGMVARGRGRIVNMSTESAFYGDTGLADYAAAKMGVIGFTRSLARELAPAGIGVNAVAPGAIRTRAHDRLPAEVIDRIRKTVPLGYVAEPEDVANVVVFLASPASRYVTGQTLLIDGGRWMI